ncbi:UNVERIFIED_CONTAM: hypothetical protein Sindi_0047200, partial [Sesamum indicum]
VKTYVPNYTCFKSDPTKETSVEWIASKIESVLKENPRMKARDIRNEIKKFGVNPQYMKMYRAKKQTMESIEGVYGCHFKWPFGNVLLATIRLDGNTGLFPVAFSVVELECKES